MSQTGSYFCHSTSLDRKHDPRLVQVTVSMFFRFEYVVFSFWHLFNVYWVWQAYLVLKCYSLETNRKYINKKEKEAWATYGFRAWKQNPIDRRSTRKKASEAGDVVAWVGTRAWEVQIWKSECEAWKERRWTVRVIVRKMSFIWHRSKNGGTFQKILVSVRRLSQYKGA